MSGYGPSPLPALMGCGVLRREIELLSRKNGWDLRPRYLPSFPHCGSDLVELSLESELERQRGDPAFVLYGLCHPRMDSLVASFGLRRVRGENCMEMLLGSEKYIEELAGGAFFLLEEWARDWKPLAGMVMGHDKASMVEIFRLDRTHILGIRTPASGDFSAEAVFAAEDAGLPLRWIDVGLDVLEARLLEAMDLRPGEHP